MKTSFAMQTLKLTQKNEPKVDFNLANKNNFSARDFIYFLEKDQSQAQILGSLIPPEPTFSDLHLNKLGFVVDISAHSPLFPKATKQTNPWMLSSLLVSLAGHSLVCLSIIVLTHFLNVFDTRPLLPFEQAIPVEVAFGFKLPDSSQKITSPGVTQPAQNPKAAEENPKEATKRPETLPQLPKLLQVDAPEKPKDAIPLPNLTPTPKTAATPTPTPLVTLEKTPDPSIRALKPEEIAKRMEKEQRRVGEKNQEGVHQSQGKSATESLPKNPFAEQSDNPPLPSALQEGDLSGRFNATPTGWAAKAKAHIKRFWELPDITQYDSNLVAIVRVQVNMFGKIQRIEFIQKTSDPQFNAEVELAIQKSDPFPSFENENERARLLILRFTPHNVK